jgi:hypothetical protein
LQGIMRLVFTSPSCPFKGQVIWLTPEQGGRNGGPPPDPENYAQVAHVPPQTVASGTASFVLRGFDPTAMRSAAEGGWLLVENRGVQRVEPGAVIVVTEGTRVVAYFTVREVIGA